MTEMIEVYDKEGNLVKAGEREDILNEIEKGSKEKQDVSLAVPIIYVILRNSEGKLYIVKRGSKPENPFMYDKSVEGHVKSGEDYDSAMQREVKEEIGAEVIIADMKDFHSKLRETDTKEYAVVRAVDFNPWMKSMRAVKDGEPWEKRHRVMIYAGVYDGPVEFVDGEAEGLQLLEKGKLLEEMNSSPEKFTYDLAILMRDYSVFF